MNLTQKSLGSGRYLLVEPLGEGGMASVYRGWDQRLGVWRAIKVLSPSHAAKPKLRARFESEAKAMAMLEHPHIVRIYDVSQDGALLYIVMEVIEGGDLVDWQREFGAMPPRMAVDVLLQVCEALRVAHEKGVIHRDIKPHNILLTSDGSCRVSDFGIARMEEVERGRTRTGMAMGTHGYMAPEQRTDARGVDARADVYSLGALLYTLLTHNDPVELYRAAVDDTLLEGVPACLADIIVKACSYRREQRHVSVDELVQELRAVRGLLPPLGDDLPTLVREPPLSRPIPNAREYVPAHQVSQPTLLPMDGVDPIGELPPPQGWSEPPSGAPPYTGPPVTGQSWGERSGWDTGADSGAARFQGFVMGLGLTAAVLIGVGLVLIGGVMFMGRDSQAPQQVVSTGPALVAPPTDVQLPPADPGSAAPPPPVAPPGEVAAPVTPAVPEVAPSSAVSSRPARPPVTTVVQPRNTTPPKGTTTPAVTPPPEAVVAVEPVAPAVVAPAVVAPVVPVAVEPPPTAPSAPTVELQDLSVDVVGDEVIVRGLLSNADVKPFHYPVEGADSRFPTQYVVQLKGGVSTFGLSKLPVASPFVSSVSISQSGGKLLVYVNSPSQVPPKWSFESGGKSFTVKVHAP